MMNPTTHIPQLVRQLLPPHKRKPLRLQWLGSLTEPLLPLFAEFSSWRDDTRLRVNVTSQVKVLEGYLRKKYNEPFRIKIETFDDQLLAVGLEPEGAQFMHSVGMLPEATPIEVPLSFEMRENFDGVDFRVILPPEVDRDRVRVDIEHLKRATARYEII